MIVVRFFYRRLYYCCLRYSGPITVASDLGPGTSRRDLRQGFGAPEKPRAGPGDALEPGISDYYSSVVAKAREISGMADYVLGYSAQGDASNLRINGPYCHGSEERDHFLEREGPSVICQDY